ncbi:MAG: HYR domain-containing protein [Saprospirales bacterium]|nr:HYR domain-containing protein [Saprospirales bacterium]
MRNDLPTRTGRPEAGRYVQATITGSLFALSLLFPALSFGQIYQYTNASSGVPATVAPNVTGTSLSRGAGLTTTLTCTGATEGFGADGWPSYGYGGSSMLATPNAAGDYIEFSITPDPGYSLNITGLTAKLRREPGTATTRGPSQVRYAYSLNGFSTFTQNGANLGPNNNSTCSNTGTNRPWASFTSFTTTATVTFRIYGLFGGTNGLGDLFLRDVIVSGTVICEQPAAFDVTGGGSYCAGGSGVAVGLSDSETGVSYQLQVDNTNTGSPVAGTGNAIAFGDQTAAGAYTVIATNTTTNCTATMNGSATVSIDPLPTAFGMTESGSSCTGKTIGLDGSETGVSYQLQLNGNDIGMALPGTGMALDFGLQTAVGVYTVVATNTTTTCTNTMSGTVEIALIDELALTSEGPASAECMNEITVDIAATSGFCNLGSLQYGVSWNPANFIYVSHTALTIDGDAPAIAVNSLTGELRYTWLDIDGVCNAVLTDNTVLLRITFKVMGCGVEDAPVTITSLTSPPLAIEAADCDGPFDVAVTNNAKVDIDDTTPPTLTCPDDLTLECDTDADPDYAAQILTWLEGFSATDVCDPEVAESNDFDDNSVLALSCDLSQGLPVTFTALDDCDNTATCIRTVYLDDTKAPTLNCPPGLSAVCAISEQLAYADFAVFATAGGSASDACGLDESTFMLDSETPNNMNCPQTVTRVYKIEDQCGNTGTCSQTVTIDDEVPPSLTCPPGLSAVCSISEQPPYASYSAFTSAMGSASDNCGVNTMSLTLLSQVSNGQTCPEVVTRTYQIADLCGNLANCVQTIAIDDEIPPTITCPPNLTATCSASEQTPYADYSAFTDAMGSAGDNCGINPASFAFVGGSSNSMTCPEVVTRTYRIADLCGNTTTCTQTVTVDDNTLPALTCPPDLTASCSADEQPAYTSVAGLVMAGGSASDNCDLNAMSFLSSEVSDNGSCPEMITRTYQVSDLCGNTATCSHKITVDDNVPPTALCQDITIELAPEDLLPVPVPADQVDNGSSDNCDLIPVEIISLQLVGCANIGVQSPTTLQATDACGNTSTCTAQVYLTFNGGGTSLPTVSLSQTPALGEMCPNDTYTLNLGGSNNPPGTTYMVTWTIAPTFTTTMPLDENVTLGGDFGGVPGEGMLPTSALSLSGPINNTNVNSVTITFTVTPKTNGCPGTPQMISVIVRPLPQVVSIAPAPPAAICSGASVGAFTVTHNIVPGPSSNQIMWMWSGTDITANPANGSDTDGSDGLIVSATTLTNTSATAQTATLTIIPKRLNANNLLCEGPPYTVQILVEPAPQISCPPAVEVGTDEDLCSAVVKIMHPQVNTNNANCPYSMTIAFSGTPGAPGLPMGGTVTPGGMDSYTFGLGETTVTYSVTDGAMNNTTCSYTVTVADEQNPEITCPVNLSLQCVDGSDYVAQIETWIATASATDNCDQDVDITDDYVNAVPDLDCDLVNGLTVTFTATDDAENTAECTATVYLDDTQAPTLTCPPTDLTLECGVDGPDYVASINAWIATATVTDACDQEIFVETDYNGSTVPALECTASPSMGLTITFTAQDDCDNTATPCMRTVYLVDTQDPTATAGTINMCYPTVAAAEAAAIAATTSSDDCPGTLTPTASTAGTCSAVITVTVTDMCGNTATVTYTTKIDNTAPTATAGTINMCYPTVAAAEAAAIAATTSSDNCPGTLTTTASTAGTCSAVITVTVTDMCGNTATVTYTTKIDNTAPTATAGQIAMCYPTVAAAEAAAIAATTSNDNCPGTLTTTASTAGTCSAVITVTVTDMCGNAATVTYTTKIDNTAPTATAGTINMCYPTVAAAEAAAIAATTSSDNCPGTLTTTASTVGDCSATITVTVTDMCGNTATATYTTKIDNTAPTATAGTINMCYPTVAAAEAAAIVATTSNDNCPGTLTTTASTAGTCSAVITVTVTDMCGNAATVTYTTKIDNAAPTATAGTINMCYPTVAAAEAAAIAATTSSDNCPGTLTTTASTAGTCSAVITVTVTDMCGNTATVTYTTKIDNTAPTATAGQIAMCYPTVAAAEAAAIAATTSNDNCPGTLTTTASTAGTCSAVITVTVTDMCGNAATVTYTTKIDNTAPTATAGQIAMCYPTVAAAEAAAIAATTSNDNCPGTLATTASTAGTCSAVITVTVTDMCGNTATVTYTTKIDNTPPTATAGTINMCYPTVAAAEAAAIAATTSSDNCPGTLTTTASTAGTCSVVITVTVTDMCGNAASVTYTTKIDNTAPTATAGTINMCYPTVAAAEAAAIAATTSSDNCPGTLTTTASTAGTCSAVITVTVTDMCGNAATVTYTTKIDNTAPTATAGQIAMCYPTVAAAEAAAIAATTSSDDCPGTLTTTASTAGTCSAVITVTVTDMCGNTATVTYTTKIDNTAPTATAGTIAMCYPTVAAAEAAAIAATMSSDNCPGMLNATATTIPSTAGDCQVTIIVTVTDMCGNAASATYITKIDGTPPMATAGQIAMCYPTVTAAEAAAIAATTSSDNCPGTLTTTASTVGDCSATITVTVTDMCGNTATATYTTKIDNTPPTAYALPPLGPYTCATLIPPANIDDVTGEVDNCGGTVTVTHVGDSPAPACSGTVTRTYRLTDMCGNSTAITQVIIVNDNVAPTWTTSATALDVTLECSDANGLTAAQALFPEATDNCDPNVSNRIKTSGPFVPGSCPQAGTYTNTWTVTDDCGNTSSVFTQIITIVDTQVPTWASVAGSLDKTVECGDVAGLAAAQGLTPTANDNCDLFLTPVKTNGPFVAGPCPQAGTYTNTWVVTDDCGNTSTSVFTQVITVIDSKAPTWTTSATALDVTLECSDGTGLIAAQLLFPVATDNCDMDVTNIVKVPGTPVQGPQNCPQSETITNTWTVVDDCGTTSLVYTQVITLLDRMAPTWTTAAGALDVTVECSDQMALATAQAQTPAALDNCDQTLTPVKTAGAFAPGMTCPQEGSYTNTWTVTDDCGNTSSVYTQIITVTDNTLPTWSTSATALDVTLECSDATGLAAAQALFPVAGDLCDQDVTNIVKTSGMFVPGTPPCVQAGTYTNTWTVTDDCGNTSSVFTQIITIIDNTPPTATAGQIAPCYPTEAEAEAAAIAATTSGDNCPGTLTTTASTSGDCSAVITVTVTDVCGNSAMVTYNTRIDNTPPTFSAPADIMIFRDADCEYDESVEETGDVTNEMDNCGGVVQATYEDEVDETDPCNVVITRTWSLVDDCGNTASDQVQIITVKDNTPPVAVCQDITLELGLNGMVDIQADSVAGQSYDNCGEIDIEIVSLPLTCANLGLNTVNVTITDQCGNTSACTAQVTLTLPGGVPALPTVNLTQSDNVICSGDKYTLDFGGANNPPGTEYMVTWTISPTFTNTMPSDNNVFLHGDFGAPTPPAVGEGMVTTAANMLMGMIENLNLNSVNITFTVTPKFAPCAGTPATITVTVRPLSKVTLIDPEPPAGICSGAQVGGFTIGHNLGNGTTDPSNSILWSWSGDNLIASPPNGMDAGGGSPNALYIPVTTLTNTGTTTTMAMLTITPQRTADGETCPGMDRVIVIKVEPLPAIDCPGDITLATTDGGDCDTTLTLTHPDLNLNPDYCPATMTIAFSNGMPAPLSLPMGGAVSPGYSNDFTFSKGQTIVTYTVTDGNNNTATCSFAVTVTDNDPPVISCPAPITVDCSVNLDPGGATGTATATDNCPPAPTLSHSDEISSGTLCPQNNYVVFRTWMATDGAGNTASCTQVITVTDNVPPTISCPANTTVDCTESTLPPATGTAGATDNCSTPEIGYNDGPPTPGDCPQEYTINRTWLARDACGNTAGCVQTIFVQDITPPMLSCPPAVSVECSDELAPGDPGQGFPTGFATVSDNCDMSPALTHTDVEFTIPMACPQHYIIERTWTAVDDCGNSTSCVQSITVDDNTPPVIAEEATDETVECDGQGNLYDLQAWLDNHGGAVAEDNCGDISWSNDFDGLSDDCGATGSATVTFTATDECGNEVQTTATFAIIDVTAPVITTPAADLTVECDGAGNGAALMDWLASNGGAVATDACGTVNWSNNFDGLSDDCGATGSAMVTFTATDECGNEVQTTATFTIIDETAPVITTPAADLTVDCDGQGNLDDLQAWLDDHGGAVATDACGDVEWTHNFDGLAGGCAATGSAEVTFTATDECGNTAQTTATFTINDTTPPDISVEASDETVECDGQGNGADLMNWLASNGGASASDNCGDITWSNDFDGLSDDCGATGSVEVTFTATDACGNTDATTATFTIEDTTPPVISEEATDETVECDGQGNLTDLQVWLDNYGGAVAADICSGVSWSNDFYGLSDDCGATGSATVTFTVTDACGNTTATTATFSIEDTTDPVFSGVPANTTVECNAVPMPATPTAADACDASVQIDIETVSTQSTDNTSCGYTNYTITHTWTATDDCNNSTTTQQVITVQDTQAPVLSGVPGDITAECSAVPGPASPMATDNCDPEAVISFSQTSTQSTDINNCTYTNYTITRTWTAVDNCGNATTQTQIISVSDNTAPTIVCPPDITFLPCDASLDPALNMALGSALAMDNCDPNVVVSFADMKVVGQCPQDTIITRTWQAADNCQNAAACIQIITKRDVEPPAIVCPPNKTVECAQNQSFDPYLPNSTLGVATATDNCDPGPLPIGYADAIVPTACDQEYTINRTWIDDACHNSRTCLQTITVTDNTPPLIDCPDNVTVECDESTLPANTGTATALDACDPTLATSYADDPPVSTLCPQESIITRHWISSDGCGNAVACTQTIVVDDSKAPTWTTAAGMLDRTVECSDAAGLAAAQSLFPVATDNCDNDVSDIVKTPACLSPAQFARRKGPTPTPGR